MSMVDYPKGELTAEQIAFVRAAAARYRMDEAGPLMLEALRKAEKAFDNLSLGGSISDHVWVVSGARVAHESVRAAIAAAE